MPVRGKTSDNVQDWYSELAVGFDGDVLSDDAKRRIAGGQSYTFTIFLLDGVPHVADRPLLPVR